MRLLLVHPSALMYSEIFLRLEPLGLERVAGAAREAGHEVRVVDLQVLSVRRLRDEVRSFRPEALGISLNYLANIPEAIRLAERVKEEVPGCFVFLGGHSVSFVAEEVIEQAGVPSTPWYAGRASRPWHRCWRRCGTAGWTGCRASSRRRGAARPR